MTICSVLLSLCEGVVGSRKTPLGKAQFPNLYNDARIRILRKRTAAKTRYLRGRVGGSEEVSSVVATGSYAAEDMCVANHFKSNFGAGWDDLLYRCT